MEMTHVILKVDITRDQERGDNSVQNFSSITEIGCCGLILASVLIFSTSFLSGFFWFARAHNQFLNGWDIFKNGTVHRDVLLKEVIPVNQVQHMLERVDWLLLHQGELVEEWALSNCVRLCHNQVVSVWESLKRILKEVLRAWIKCGFHTEEGDSEGVLSWFWGLRNMLLIVDLLADILGLGVWWIIPHTFNFRQKNKLFLVDFTTTR